MIDNPYYTHDFHGDYDLIGIGALDLEEGGSIPDCRLAVATFGTLNEAKDNAILIPTWYSGTHQICATHTSVLTMLSTRASISSSAWIRSATVCRRLPTTPPASTQRSPCRTSLVFGSGTMSWPRSGCSGSISVSNASRW